MDIIRGFDIFGKSLEDKSTESEITELGLGFAEKSSNEQKRNF